MKEVKIKLYTFDELEEKIQDIIIEQNQYKHDFAEDYYSDWEATLKAFEKLTCVKVKNWSVDSCSYDYRFEFTMLTYIPDGFLHEVDGEKIKGKLLWRWIMNNVWDNIFPRKEYYKFESGYNREKKRCPKQRMSHIFRENWDNCVLTGVCYDYDILKPIADYLSNPYKEDYTLYDLVTDCLDNFFTAWKNEIEYCNSYKGIKEWMLECDTDEYYANGKVFDGVLEEE